MTPILQGTFANDAVGWDGNYVKGQQWATENPLTTPNYAKQYGLPTGNTGQPDWVTGVKIQPGTYTSQPSPASYNHLSNVGGATEILPANLNNIRIDWFHMP